MSLVVNCIDMEHNPAHKAQSRSIHPSELIAFNEANDHRSLGLSVQYFLITSRHRVHYPFSPDSSLQSTIQRHLFTPTDSNPPLLSKAIVHTTNPLCRISTSQPVQARCRTSLKFLAEGFARDYGPSSRNLYRSSALSPGILPFLFPFTMSMLSGLTAPNLGRDSSSSLPLTLFSRGARGRIDAGDVETELVTLL